MYKLISLLLLLAAVPCAAADHYVSASGSATWANSVNISTPCSISTAMANAQAGDTVYLRGGTYTYNGPTSNPYHGIYEPSNSGTSEENRIIFKAYTGETPTFSVTWSPSAWTGFIFASGDHNYITFDGIKVQTTSATQNAGFYLGGTDDSTHASYVKVTNCTIVGGSTLIPYDDNYDLNRMEDCDYCEFSYNKVGPFPGGTGGDDNYAGLKMYHDNHALIKNNEFSDCLQGGISIKGYNNYCTFSYNYFHGGDYGLRTCSYTVGSDVASIGQSVHDNLFANINQNGYWLYAEGANSYGNSIYNNTFYSCGYGIQIGDAQTSSDGWKVYNNIFDTTPQVGDFAGTNYISQFDHNQFSTLTFYVDSYTSLSSWQSSSELAANYDAGCGSNQHPGCGSLASNPQFVNTSGNLNQIADFKLATGSPCIGAGRNGVDMGADIDNVGISGGSGSISTTSAHASGSFTIH